MSAKRRKKAFRRILFLGFIIGVITLLGFNKVVEATSTDDFCARCHVHPHSTESWMQSVHYNTASGTVVHCVDCHLPPKGEGYIPQKIATGIRDIYGTVFKDSADYHWELKSRPENAVHFTRDVSCVHCHVNLFPLEITHEGLDAHLYYEQQEGEVACIKCHLDAGHYHEGYLHAANESFGSGEKELDTVYLEPYRIKAFSAFEETIPNSSVTFTMLPIPGGSFKIGAPEDDKYAEEDEYPQVEVQVDSFFMAEIEVSWDEFLAWYAQTSGEGRTSEIGLVENVDALSGATPPYGNPGQGWGKGQRPAITMTYYAAEKYCEWLSQVCEKIYRLPTEAEWEYAARGGSDGPYFFEGAVKDYMDEGLKAKLFGVDTSNINSYIVYKENSQGMSQLPSFVKPNPFGLKNMLGNVAEFCQDVYLEEAYSDPGFSTNNPVILEGAEEHVIRGGSFLSNAADVRSSNRDHTRHDQWMRTDPQIPKSLWWYSDSYHVGFRVICEYKN